MRDHFHNIGEKEMKEKVLMKTSSKKTMLTAAVLVALSSGTTYAATPGTVDTQELFHGI